METKRKFYWLWAAIGLLLCLNLLTVGWVVRRLNTARTNRPLPEAMLVKQLGFSPEQRKAYRQSRVQLRQQAKPHEDSLRVLRTTLLDKIKDTLVTDAELDQLSEAMFRQNRQVTRIRFRHWQQVRSLCTPEQQIKFDQLIRRVGQGLNNPGLRGRLQARRDQKSD
ncbi:Spy/CpxP family protein refolding chaperone [uncultured Fibrella sp.]|uniref:Spy/CpxP family protein refolding chaperone n=1 Tax=uncultured Fibrella sp. TaxID=1284596 RepID=UPI0035C95EE7